MWMERRGNSEREPPDGPTERSSWHFIPGSAGLIAVRTLTRIRLNRRTNRRGRKARVATPIKLSKLYNRCTCSRCKSALVELLLVKWIYSRWTMPPGLRSHAGGRAFSQNTSFVAAILNWTWQIVHLRWLALLERSWEFWLKHLLSSGLRERLNRACLDNFSCRSQLLLTWHFSII